MSATARPTGDGCPTSTSTTGHCTFVDDHTLGHRRRHRCRITADQIVIAAGGRVNVADIPGLDEVEFHTSDTVMRLPDLPRRMTIVGGGYVAAEFAHVFSALGTEVTQVAPRVLAAAHSRTRTSRAPFTELAGRQWDVRLEHHG